MRIPRTNFPPASFHEGEEAGTPDDRQSQESIAQRRLRLLSETTNSDQPTWERHFLLAPNVRFTRTPDRDLHPELQIPHAAVEQRGGPVMVPDPSPSVAELREMLSTMMILQGGGAAPVSVVPAASETPMNDNAVPAFGAVASVAPAAMAEAPVAVEAVPSEAVRALAQLSDFAFWEALDFAPTEDIAPTPVAAPLVAAPVVPAPQPVAYRPPAPAVQPAAPVSLPVTDLYRSVAIEPKRMPAPQPAITRSAATKPAAPAPSTAPAPSEPAPAVAGNWPWSRRAKTVAEAAAVIEPVVVVAAATAQPEPVRAPVAAQPAAAVLGPAPRSSVAVSMPFNIERVSAPRLADGGYEFPPRDLLQDPPETVGEVMTQEQLERNAGLLESVLEDFGIRGEIIHVRPGPVVTLYEFEPPLLGSE